MTRPSLLPFLSSVEGVAWPPIVTGKAAPLAALVSFLDASQWLPTEELHDRALKQLVITAAHCIRESPLFAERMRMAGLSPEDLGQPGGLQKLPPMTRRQAQEAGERLFCRMVPPEHKPLHEGRTSGSTGEPLTIRRTAISFLLRQATSIRDHLWHRRDFAAPTVRINANHKTLVNAPTWGPPVDLLFYTGPSLGVPISTPVVEQAALIRAHQPGVLLTLPNNIPPLIDELAKSGGPPKTLKHVRTLSETVTTDLRRRSKEFFNLDIEDIYGTADAGIIADQCSDCGRYHVIAETIIAEVVNDSGGLCRPGEIGRVIVTDLTNFATPMIRYENGDYAEVGDPAACGRGLPTLNRILGRERNLMLLPDGTRQYPVVGFYAFRDVAPVLQFQFVQTDLDRIEVNLVVARPLARSEEAALSEVIQRALRAPFTLVFRYHSEPLPRGANGKFEEFICKMAS